MARSFTIEEGGPKPKLTLLMSAALKALRDLGGSGTIQEIDARVIENEGVTEEEQDVLLRNGQSKELNYRLGWARTFLRHGGLVENPSRGVWVLADEGKKIAPDDMDSLDKLYIRVNDEVNERTRQKREKRKNQAEEIQESEQAGEETPDGTDWKEDLLTTLKGMDPAGFERLAQRLLREAGFIEVKVTGKAGDGGIDGVGILRVNLISFRIVFQCKRYQGSVGSGAIRDFRGGLQGKADKGLFITTGTFTSDAQREAVRAGATAIDLIDGQQLCDLLQENELGVKTKMVKEIDIDQGFFDSI